MLFSRFLHVFFFFSAINLIRSHQQQCVTIQFIIHAHLTTGYFSNTKRTSSLHLNHGGSNVRIHLLQMRIVAIKGCTSEIALLMELLLFLYLLPPIVMLLLL